MHPTVYLRLVALTGGTLLPFFWMIVILGHRRQRDFERILFFLCLALVFFFGSSLGCTLRYGLAAGSISYCQATPWGGRFRYGWWPACSFQRGGNGGLQKSAPTTNRGPFTELFSMTLSPWASGSRSFTS